MCRSCSWLFEFALGKVAEIVVPPVGMAILSVGLVDALGEVGEFGLVVVVVAELGNEFIVSKNGESVAIDEGYSTEGILRLAQQ